MIKSLIGATVLASLSACVFHVHVHEAPRETVVAAAEPVPAAARANTNTTIAGTVVDAAGNPVHARVALVWASGSISNTAQDSGRFSMEPPTSDPIVVHASTEDGRVAVASARPGDDDLKLVLAPGGTITIDFTSEQNMRCAVFHRDLRIEDFTLRAKSDRTQVVVPAGDIHVRVYGGGKSPSGGPGYTNDQRITIAQGETKSMTFSVLPF